jgi:hypothetical protein
MSAVPKTVRQERTLTRAIPTLPETPRWSPNVRLPNPIAAFRAQGRLGQLSARNGLMHRSKNPLIR